MASLKFNVVTGEHLTGAGLRRTELQLVAAANHTPVVMEFLVSFKGIDSTAEPAFVEVLHQDDSTGSGSATAVTPAKGMLTDSRTITTTAFRNFDGSSQPTDTSGGKEMEKEVHPQGGEWFWRAASDEEGIPIMPGKALGFVITVEDAVKVTITARCKE